MIMTAVARARLSVKGLLVFEDSNPEEEIEFLRFFLSRNRKVGN